MDQQLVLETLFQLPEYHLLWAEFKQHCPSLEVTDEIDSHRLHSAADYLGDDLDYLLFHLYDEQTKDQQRLAAVLCRKIGENKTLLFSYIEAASFDAQQDELSDDEAEDLLQAAGASLSELDISLADFKHSLEQASFDKSCLVEYLIPLELFTKHSHALDEYREQLGTEGDRQYLDELFAVYKGLQHNG